jgi:predicted amidohydrolase YtcJ
MTRRAAVCLAAAAALLASPRPTLAAEPADLVLKNAVVHTVDAKRPRADAVAVRGNRIVAVGSTAEVQAFVGPKTRVLDLAGRTVVPGFDDSHAHMLGIGFARLDVDLVGAHSYAEVVERVARAVKGRRPGTPTPRGRAPRGTHRTPRRGAR